MPSVVPLRVERPEPPEAPELPPPPRRRNWLADILGAVAERLRERRRARLRAKWEKVPYDERPSAEPHLDR